MIVFRYAFALLCFGCALANVYALTFMGGGALNVISLVFCTMVGLFHLAVRWS